MDTTASTIMANIAEVKSSPAATRAAAVTLVSKEIEEAMGEGDADRSGEKAAALVELVLSDAVSMEQMEALIVNGCKIAAIVVTVMTSLDDVDDAEAGMHLIFHNTTLIRDALSSLSAIHHTLRELPLEAREAGLALSEDIDGENNYCRKALSIFAEIEDAELDSIVADVPDMIACAKKIFALIQSSSGDGGSGSSADAMNDAMAMMKAVCDEVDETLVVRMHSHIKNLPKSALTMVYDACAATEVDAAMPIARAFVGMESKAVGKVCKQLPELAIAADTLQTAFTDSAPADDGFKVQRAESATIIMQVLAAVPAESRRELISLAPDTMRAPIEQATGMGASLDVKDMTRIFNVYDVASSGGFEELELKEQIKMGLKVGSGMALTVGKATVRKESKDLKDWIKADKCSLRLLSFFAGWLTIATGVSGIVLQTLNNYRLAAIWINVYLLLFGLLIVIIETKSMCCSVYFAARITFYFTFLHRAFERGILYVFVALLSGATYNPYSSLYGKKTYGFIEIMNVICFGVMMVLGLVYILSSIIGQRKLRNATSKVASVEDLRHAFDAADVERRGTLPQNEVSELLTVGLGTHLTEAEVRACVMLMDTSHDDQIDFDELSAWWSGDDGSKTTCGQRIKSCLSASSCVSSSTVPLASTRLLDSEATPPGTPPTAVTPMQKRHFHFVKRGSGLISIINVILGLAIVVMGTYGVVLEVLSIGDSTSSSGTVEELNWLLRLIVNIFIILGGLLIAFIELAVQLGRTYDTRQACLSLAHLVEHAEFVKELWGRGVLIAFVSTLLTAELKWPEKERASAAGSEGFSIFLQTVQLIALLSVMGVCLIYGVLLVVIGCIAKSSLHAAARIPTKEEAMVHFNAADSDNNGTIDTIELPALLTALNIESNRLVLEAILHELDQDGDGKISSEEYLTWVVSDTDGHIAAAKEKAME